MGAGAFWDAATLQGTAPDRAFELWLSFIVSMNALLLGFNLIPAFPLDGGRIARAIAWKLTGDRTRATLFAARAGQAFGAVLIGVGLYQLLASDDTIGGLWFAVLGWLLASAARAAVAQSAFTQRLEGVTVADIMDSEPVTIPADLPAARAWDEYFLRYHGWDWFAVVETDGRYAGLAHRSALEQAGRDAPELPVRAAAAAGTADGQVRADAPLEALLGSEPLSRLGALMAVDADGRLRGVVTVEQVSRALRTRLAPS
jgi:CBS domain-containing protein